MKKMKKIFAGLVCGLLLFCTGCGQEQVRQVRSVDTAMGTVVQQTIYIAGTESAPVQDILALIRDLEERELSRRLETSEVWAMNASAGSAEGIQMSSFMTDNMIKCLEMWRRSEGAFDVTVGTVATLWDIDGWAAEERRETFAPPEAEQLAEALESCGSDKLSIEENRLRLREGMRLDLGAVGKGIALDHIASYLQEKEYITGAIISLGGSVVTYGRKPDGSSWNVGITDPADTSSSVGILVLEGQWFVSTSGDYERYVELNGIRYHHIIDPATGYPADSGVAGVTILARDGFLSDALSTACFILGEEKGMELAESYGAEVLFVGKDGRVTMSEGMRQYYQPGD